MASDPQRKSWWGLLLPLVLLVLVALLMHTFGVVPD